MPMYHGKPSMYLYSSILGQPWFDPSEDLVKMQLFDNAQPKVAPPAPREVFVGENPMDAHDRPRKIVLV